MTVNDCLSICLGFLLSEPTYGVLPVILLQANRHDVNRQLSTPFDLNSLIGLVKSFSPGDPKPHSLMYIFVYPPKCVQSFHNDHSVNLVTHPYIRLASTLKRGLK